ncbi:hypothetical protein [Bacillus stercoris]|uniref:hypothetical protein n=1 Tax=Bacillus stercoris TaxID=2054641 RepID=UPI003CEF4E30
MSLFKKLTKRIDESTYCYAKKGGQGLVNKKHCSCGENKCCQAFKDRERFLEHFEDVRIGDYKKRDEIIEKIAPEFEDSQWWKDNVKE